MFREGGTSAMLLVMPNKKRHIFSDALDHDFVGRLRHVADLLGNRKVAAKAANVSLDQLTRYLRGENQPAFSAMAGLCEAAGIRLDWLAKGQGLERIEDESLTNLDHHRLTSVPMVGMLECGLAGWFQPVNWEIETSLEITDPKAFAVLAHGLSMVPEGIKQGFVCICSPGVPPAKGDVIHVKRTDGYTTIKTFNGLDNEWLYLRGYLDPDVAGGQAPYDDKIRRDKVAEIATVIFIKRKI